MIKLLLIALYLLGGILITTSCKKCITCKAYDRTNNNLVNKEDYCSPKESLDESKKNYIYTWNNTQTFAECE